MQKPLPPPALEHLPDHVLEKHPEFVPNLAPVFDSGATGSIPENSSTTTVAYNAHATDSGTLTYGLSDGGDNDLFDINPSTGDVTFRVSPDFEAPGDAGGDNVYDIIVHADDGTHDTTQAAAITVTDVTDILAVAFTDKNGNHTYEADTDLLVASLLDTVDDDVLSVGDTIHWGTYPTFLDGSGTRGIFAASDTLVTALNTHSDGYVRVNTALGSVVWRDTEYQNFEAQPSDGQNGVNLFDGFFQGYYDHIVADTLSGPGEPDTELFFIYALQEGDNSFIDVLLFF